MPAAIAVPAIMAGVGSAASIGSAVIGRGASKDAAAAQIGAQQRAQQIAGAATTEGQQTAATGTAEANNSYTEALKQQLALYAPYIQAGNTSLGSLQDLAGAGGPLDQKFSFDAKDLSSDPGYAFTLSEGQKAIQRSAAAEGGLFSGSTLKSLAGYTTGTANQYFNDAYKRAADTFSINRSTALSRIGTLQGLAGMGMGSTNAAADATGATGARVGGNIFNTGQFNANLGMQGARIATGLEENKGNSQAAGDIGSANATAGGIAGVANATSRGLADYLALRKTQNLPDGGVFNTGVPGGIPIPPYTPTPAGTPPFVPNYPSTGR